MTISVETPNVAAEIAQLDFGDINTRDLDNIPDSAALLCPILIPQPNDFITSITPTTMSLGSNGDPKLNLEYTLNYVYLHAEAGSGIGAFSMYASVIANLKKILEVILGNDAIDSAIDLKIESVGNIGVIEDPAGNEFWGLLFSLRVLEYAQ